MAIFLQFNVLEPRMLLAHEGSLIDNDSNWPIADLFPISTDEWLSTMRSSLNVSINELLDVYENYFFELSIIPVVTQALQSERDGWAEPVWMLLKTLPLEWG
ncbi:MAG TPA: hypothetical protein PLV25_02085, partial [Opitutales bacterium]|nr:hypothetical protein [Opitutales bacterium]